MNTFTVPLDVPRRPITVDEYHRMGEVGLLHEDDRVELIEGNLIQMAPIGTKHIQMVNALNMALSQQINAGDAVVSVQNPILLPPLSEPQPDLTLIAPEFARRLALPQPKDVLLLIEVADSTLRYDRETKIPLYARHGLVEVWLFDVEFQSITVYRDPAPAGYRTVAAPGRDERLSPLRFPKVAIIPGDLWP